VASSPSTKGGAINFADAYQALLVNVECSWALPRSSGVIASCRKYDSGSSVTDRRETSW
jgi:hypothetical protein